MECGRGQHNLYTYNESVDIDQDKERKNERKKERMKKERKRFVGA